MDDVRIFTTPILDGIKIKEYKGIVIARNVRALLHFATYSAAGQAHIRKL